MRTFLVRLEKRNTLQDLENGAAGYKSVKNILVQCESESDIKREVELFNDREGDRYKDFNAVDIQDWDELRQKQMTANINWILNKG